MVLWFSTRLSKNGEIKSLSFDMIAAIKYIFWATKPILVWWVKGKRVINLVSKSNRESHRKFSIKNVFLDISQNYQENTCARDSFIIKLQIFGPQLYLKKEILAQALSCAFCVISMTNFFTKHLRTTATDLNQLIG